MVKKGETKIMVFITICMILISIGLSGCIEETKDKDGENPTKEDLELNLSMNKHEFNINDTSVRVNLTLKNISEKTLKTEYSFSIETFIDVWIETPINNTIIPQIYPVDPIRKKIILKPNEILTENFLLFGHPWQYSYNDFQWISGNYTIYSNYQYYKTQRIESNPIHFTIL
jgi:hypothetical protein